MPVWYIDGARYSSCTVGVFLVLQSFMGLSPEATILLQHVADTSNVILFMGKTVRVKSVKSVKISSKDSDLSTEQALNLILIVDTFGCAR